MATTTVETGTGTTSTGNEYAFTFTRRESGGTIEVKLKALKYTRERETFFTSPRFSVGGSDWELSFKFDRTFRFLPWLRHCGWRHNLKAKLLSAWNLCFCVNDATIKTIITLIEMFQKCHEYTSEGESIINCIAAIGKICGVFSLTNSGGAPPEGWHARNIHRWIATRICFPNCLKLCFWLRSIVADTEVLVFIAIVVSLITPMFYLGILVVCLTAPIWFICYYLTSPLWYQTESITSTLGLLSDEQTRLKHRVTIRHTCPFLSKTTSRKKTLRVNEICELKGFARAGPCLKPDSGFCPNGWLTIIGDIDIDGPATHVQRNNEAVQVLEEGQRVDPGLQRCMEHRIEMPFAGNGPVDLRRSGESRIQRSQANELSECVICLVNKQTSGFAHKNTVHICVCEECAKVYDNLRKQSSARCPYCNQRVEYIVYKVF